METVHFLGWLSLFWGGLYFIIAGSFGGQEYIPMPKIFIFFMALGCAVLTTWGIK